MGPLSRADSDVAIILRKRRNPEYDQVSNTSPKDDTLRCNDVREKPSQFTKFRGHPGSNRGPLDLQSNALPLSYIPNLHQVEYVKTKPK